MNIILVSGRLAKAVSLGPRQIALILGGLGALIAGLAFGLGLLLGGVRDGVSSRLTGAVAPQAEIDALAVRLGALQARLFSLDGLAKQVGKKTGIDVAPFLLGNQVSQGGLAREGAPLSALEARQQLEQAEGQLNAYHDQLSLAEAALMLPSLQNLPTLSPVPVHFARSSSFGGRIDPISGRQTFHEGIDFVGEIGTPIKASGNGVVSYAAYHAEYGNMVELDHGNGLTSRYAHNAKLVVSAGDKVAAGQVIAQLGNSGRSTGPHMHYEIRYKNVPQNPLRFMAAAEAAGKTPALRPE